MIRTRVILPSSLHDLHPAHTPSPEDTAWHDIAASLPPCLVSIHRLRNLNFSLQLHPSAPTIAVASDYGKIVCDLTTVILANSSNPTECDDDGDCHM